MSDTIKQHIQAEIDNNAVVLFMKGDADFPQCGFSARVVQILSHIGVPFKAINVLADANIRQGIKDFSNWPTIPQLYVKGEFIGGCDIVMEMFQSGELQNLLKEKNIPTTAES
ncbi:MULTISPECIES: Grx4 family monothiol glutaredoxin [Acetobacter]|uniref:Glutaredoxin n=1 Tax=Acetobacter cibinongensis TaxID=146475 RepID=A0A1Z5YY98_9PROT|nr:Grx4 family monothiol glutaredoxin [Acetobacter cibinongensis]OUJ04318.1 glutaredoxin [Acetobacter cibinongensis]GAN61194.1 glutaredoxin [Acetobacter cibinongensis]GBQ17354.1 glutaredoxin [Acetobacter cibinongensis NRIC 0482]GEL57912.1 glutaredoxin [Acetobacter cibinongensis]